MEDSKRGRIKGLNRYKGWTREEVDLLKSLMEKHEKVANIARHLNRPYQSVSLKVKEINSGEVKIKRYWKFEELKMLKALLQKKNKCHSDSKYYGKK